VQLVSPNIDWREADQRLAEPVDVPLAAREDLENTARAAHALVDGEQSDGLVLVATQVSRNAPMRQLIKTRQMTHELTSVAARYDQQTQALPRIRALLQAVEELQRDLGHRSQELQRLDRELYNEYRIASEHTQSLTNSLHKYRGRKYARKIRERDEASDRHMALRRKHEEVRRWAIGTKPDPETERIRAELARVQAELWELNPISYRDYLRRS
jgi:hypothetical protein